MEIKKRVLVLGINCYPELTGIGKYTGEMVQWFAENGFVTTMVTAPPYYPNWKVQHPYSGNRFRKEKRGENLSVYRCPLYVPARPSGLKRLIHEMTFFFSAFLLVSRLLFKKKHDFIFVVAPPFHLGFLALFYRFFKGGKIVYHIQDLQVDAAKELNMLPGYVFPILFFLEKVVLKGADVVSTISEGMRKKVMRKFSQPVLLFPNWVDISTYVPVNDRNLLKPRWGFLPENKVVLYSGSIGEKQGLDSLIKIADQLQGYRDIKFVICGIGPFKSKLIEMTNELGLRNVHFFPLQGDKVFNDFLNMADVHLILQKADASDLVMPSKLTTILAVGGLAIVTANPGTTLYDVVTQYKMGIVVPTDHGDLLKASIIRGCQDSFAEERVNARTYAVQHLDKENILKKILSDRLI